MRMFRILVSLVFIGSFAALGCGGGEATDEGTDEVATETTGGEETTMEEETTEETVEETTMEEETTDETVEEAPVE